MELSRLLPFLRFGRRWLAGAVIAYALVSVTLGGTRPAKPTFHALAVGWALALGWRRWGVCPVCSCWGRAVEVAATNLAFTLIFAEASLRVAAARAGGSPFVQAELDAYRLTPGRDYGFGLRGNRLGYPGGDFTPSKPAGVRRIAALGDSFVVGPTVPFADNYLTLLGTLLPGVEVYNFGVSGTGPREYHAVLCRDVWAFQPDLVLVSVFVGNDITETMATPRHLDPRGHALYRMVTRAGRLLREHGRRQAAPSEPAALRDLGPGLSAATFHEVEARRLAVCRKDGPAGLEKKWREALKYLSRIADDCRARGVPVAFVLIPDEFQVNPAVLADAVSAADLREDAIDLTLPQRRLAAFCAGRDVPCLDLLPAFREQRDTYTPHDTHWNERGNRLAAAAIARRVPGWFIPPTGGWPPPPTP